MNESHEPGAEPGPDDPGSGQAPQSPPPGYGQPPPPGYGQAPQGQVPGYGQPPPPGYGQAPYGQAPYGQPPYGYGGAGYGPGWQAASAPGGIPLRPLALGDIYSGALTSARRNPIATFGIAAILATIYALLDFFALLYVRTHSAPVSFTSPASPQPAGHGAVGLLDVVVYLLSLIIQFVLTGMLAAVIGNGVLGRKLSIGEAWRTVRIGHLVGTAFLLLLLVLLPFVPVAFIVLLFVAAHAGPAAVGAGVLLGLAAFVGYVIIGVRLCLTMPAVVLERLGPWKAIQRSWRLSRGSSWRLFGIKLLTAVIIGIATAVVEIPFVVAGGTMAFSGGLMSALTSGSVVAVLLTVVGGLVASTLMQPMKTGVTVLLYLDIRMRREGFDLTLRNATDRHQPTDDELADIWRAPEAPVWQPSVPGQWPAPAPGSWSGQGQWPAPSQAQGPWPGQAPAQGPGQTPASGQAPPPGSSSATGQWPSAAGQWQPPGPWPQQDPPAVR
ncbi:MAG TPA: hypothetical protein VEL03_19565 [Streptosporangiaceae bacterium]|nr:hypothetical protein [Streptosporangiaceae bacterium]